MYVTNVDFCGHKIRVYTDHQLNEHMLDSADCRTVLEMDRDTLSPTLLTGRMACDLAWRALSVDKRPAWTSVPVMFARWVTYDLPRLMGSLEVEHG